MPQQDDAATRSALLAERARIESEIAEYTHGDDSAFPSAPRDTTDGDVGDEVDAADDLEEDERNEGIVAVLRDRLAEIDARLARLDTGKSPGM